MGTAVKMSLLFFSSFSLFCHLVHICHGVKHVFGNLWISVLGLCHAIGATTTTTTTTTSVGRCRAIEDVKKAVSHADWHTVSIHLIKVWIVTIVWRQSVAKQTAQRPQVKSVVGTGTEIRKDLSPPRDKMKWTLDHPLRIDEVRNEQASR